MRHDDIANSVFCLGLACARDLAPIKYKRKVKPPKYDPVKTKWQDLLEEEAERRPAPHEVEVYSFPQTWSSTALGFGGIGGQAMTTAQTTVCIEGRSAAVYFGVSLAYAIDDFNMKLIEDLHQHNMAEVSDKGKYRHAPAD